MKVLVGISGGVDSMVAALLMQRKGYTVIGTHFQFWHEDFMPEKAERLPQNKCCDITALQTAQRSAKRLGIPLYVLNFRDAFKREVVDTFIEGAENGETRNPCVACNRSIKFGVFLEKMRELGCDKVATGHYARIQQQGDAYTLHQARDSAKDQSYFLYHLPQEKLRHIELPLGDLHKEAVVALAKDAGYDFVAERKESQGVCFFPEAGPQGFLQRHLPEGSFQFGPILTTSGKEVGTHLGLALYTRGQRKGIQVGGLTEPHFVVDIDHARNALIIGPESATYQPSFTLRDCSFVAGLPPATSFTADIQIRYHGSRTPAQITLHADATATVTCTPSPRAVNPGQIAVFLSGDRILGGGVITA